MTTQNTENNLRSLPIFKHFSESEINSQINSFRKGEKGLFWFIKLGILIAAVILFWKYILPPVMVAAGKYLAMATTAALIILTILAMPVIIKCLRSFTRFLHKTFISYHPFEELEHQRDLMLQNQQNFRIAKGKISQLKTDMEINAAESEKEAKTWQSKILRLDEKAKQIKSDMEAMVAKDGVAAKGTDEYVQLNSDFVKTVSESQRIAHQLSQASDFVTKYGARAAIMKKFGQKLVMVETSMDIKVLDFDATIDILKKDYEFAQKSRQATESAKSAMLFTKGWELEYALEVVTNTISQDIAITAGNLKDIDTLTASYAVDSDELYTNLDTLANNINAGTDVVPSAKKFSNPEYKLTEDEKQKSGGFGDLF